MAAQELDKFNRNIVGLIEVIDEFRGNPDLTPRQLHGIRVRAKHRRRQYQGPVVVARR